MTQDKPEKPLFRRLRRIPGEIGDAARTVTGHSASEEMAEFTDAYADVLQGLHSEVTTFERRLQLVEAEQSKQNAESQSVMALQQEIAQLKRRLVLTTVAASVASVIAVVALIVALL